MGFKLLFAVDKSRFFHISQFAESLEKKGIKCKVIDDLDIYDSEFADKKYLRWLKKPKKLQSILDEFKPDAVFTERVSHLSSLILKFDFPLISNNGLPGNLVAESLEGIKITVFDIISIDNLCV